MIAPYERFVTITAVTAGCNWPPTRPFNGQTRTWCTSIVKKTKELVADFGRSPSTISGISIHDMETECVESTKPLRVTITSNLSWGEHVDNIHSKASQSMYFLTLLQCVGTPANNMLKVYTTVVCSITEYVCAVVWHVGLTNQQLETAGEHPQGH